MNFFILILLASTLIGCERSNMGTIDLSRLNKISQQEWNKLAGKKIFFGHQSVGFNIMDGVADIINSDSSIRLKVKKTKQPSDFAVEGIFAHDMIGKNEDPKAKIIDFKGLIEGGIGNRVDIAFFKFCYVDVHKDTDVQLLFDSYVNTMESLQEIFPNVKFIHFTVPIRIKAKGVKLTVKRLLRIAIDEDQDELKRSTFNNLLRERYSKTGRLFDLAYWESTYSDGKRNNSLVNGQNVEFLIPGYSKDGRHLNESGRAYIAAMLLSFLSKQ